MPAVNYYSHYDVVCFFFYASCRSLVKVKNIPKNAVSGKVKIRSVFLITKENIVQGYILALLLLTCPFGEISLFQCKPQTRYFQTFLKSNCCFYIQTVSGVELGSDWSCPGCVSGGAGSVHAVAQPICICVSNVMFWKGFSVTVFSA